MSISSYSKVDAVEQKDMVNSGVGGAKDRNRRIEVGVKRCYEHRTCNLPYHIQAPIIANCGLIHQWFYR